MSTVPSGRCPDCGEFMLFPRTHRCPPRWLVWCPEDGEELEDARKFFARDAAQAAERWAEHDDRDSTEYRIVGGTDVVVRVKPAHDETAPAEDYGVSGCPVPEYTARKVRRSATL